MLPANRFLIIKFFFRWTNLDLSKVLATEVQKLIQTEALAHAERVELYRYIPKVEPRPQPFITQMLQRWINFYHEEL